MIPNPSFRQRICRFYYVASVLLLLLVSGGHALAGPVEHSLLDTLIVRTLRSGARNPDSAAAALMTIQEKCRQENDVRGQAACLIACGILYVNGENDPVPALEYLRKARPLIPAAAREDAQLWLRWYSFMGTVFTKTGQLDSATYYYTLALETNLKARHTDYNRLLQNYRNLAIIYFETEQFDKVLYYAGKTIRTARSRHMQPELFGAYLISAAAYFEQKQYDSSARYLDLAEGVPVTPADAEQKILYELRGVLLLQGGAPLEAIRMLKASLALNRYGSTASLKGLGRAYARLRQYGQAEQYLLDAAAEEEKLRGVTSLLVEAVNDLADLYDSSGRYREAYTCRSRAARLERLRSDRRRLSLINQLETRYRSAEQAKQIAAKQLSLLSAENNIRKKNLWIGITACLALSLSVVVLLLYQKHRIQAHRAAALLQQQEIAKLKAVIDAEEKERSRIGRELHDDIMGRFSIIRMNIETLPDRYPVLAGSAAYDAIKEQVADAGYSIRQTAHNLAPDALLSDGLAQAILYFCSNVQRRSGLHVNFQHYGRSAVLPEGVAVSLYRMTQELLQNVIKHARATHVLVQLNQREDMLTLAVEDDGIGFDPGSSTGGGTGIKSIRTRIRALQGSLDIHPRQPRGTSVTLEVFLHPVNKHP